MDKFRAELMLTFEELSILMAFADEEGLTKSQAAGRLIRYGIIYGKNIKENSHK